MRKSSIQKVHKKPKHRVLSNIGSTGPVHVALAGVGGNGSQMLTKLARIDLALRSLQIGSLAVDVYDADTVSPSNIGRQLFRQQQVGINKAVAKVNELNIGFGTAYQAFPEHYRGQMASCSMLGAHMFTGYDFLITCVDSTKARLDIIAACDKQAWGMQPKYWLDMGNDHNSGQIFLGQISDAWTDNKPVNTRVKRLPTVIEMYPSQYDPNEPEDNTPSCSLAEALEQQDLFVNDMIASAAAHLLWTMLRHGEIECVGYEINLGLGMTLPTPIRYLTMPRQKPRAWGRDPRRLSAETPTDAPLDLAEIGLRQVSDMPGPWR